MRNTRGSLLFLALAFVAPAHADVTVSTLITTPLAIEGLTSDDSNNLYTTGRTPGAGLPCPVWRIPIDNPALTIVGLVPAPSSTGQCSPSGLAFGPDGMLYVADTDRIYRFTPSVSSPPTATVFASNVPGTNGLAFDWTGEVWTADGTTGMGRVWKIDKQGAVTEMFRVPPLSNEVNLVAGTGGVGRDVRSLPPGTITVTATSRNAANTAGSQPLVANGVQFDLRRNLYIADTARGAIWRAHLNSDKSVASATGCDSTFTANTLCLTNVHIQHPMLEGADGFVLDAYGRFWVDANERNAIVFIFTDGRVIEVFRNPVDPATKLRNLGPLETPTSPVVAGHKFCTANSDGNRRDNSPNTVGEIGGTGQPRGKISCINQPTNVPGLSLPIH
jgi:sugar lactone lactonase YvrE